jgi:hypothetical protein
LHLEADLVDGTPNAPEPRDHPFWHLLFPLDGAFEALDADLHDVQFASSGTVIFRTHDG